MQEKTAKKQKVCICVPVYNNFPSRFLKSFLALMQQTSKEFIVQTLIVEENPVDKSRNTLIKGALALNPDYIFFLDADNITTSDTIIRLAKVLQNERADIASALYFEKAKPYMPVIREYRNGGFWRIENPELGKIIHIDGCGMGSCLIRTEAFRKLKYPWFKFSYEKWGYKDTMLSEDLYFCRSARNAGMKLVCDTGLISGHEGAGVDAIEFATWEQFRLIFMKDRDELIQDVVEFTGESLDEVEMKLLVAQKWIADEWKEKDPQTSEEIKQFYKQTKNYIYDLVEWHIGKRRSFDNDLVTGLVQDMELKGNKVLDVGCGIGQNSYLLSEAGFEVTIADLDSVTLDFAEHRFKKHNRKYKSWKMDKEESPEPKYDVILIYDLIEHLPLEDLKELVEKLEPLKHDKTKVFGTVSFGTQGGTHPMHLEESPEKNALIERLLNKKSS